MKERERERGKETERARGGEGGRERWTELLQEANLIVFFVVFILIILDGATGAESASPLLLSDMPIHTRLLLLLVIQ